MDIVSENLCGTSVDLTWCCGLLSGRWYFRTLLWDEVTHCPVTGYKRGVIGKKLIKAAQRRSFLAKEGAQIFLAIQTP